MSDRFARLKKILLQAADLPEEEQKAYLDKACGDDSELRHEAESILTHGARPSEILQNAGIKSKTAVETEVEAQPIPAEIGGYRIIRKLGEGGMGVVYEAKQQSPRRRVALKVVRSGAYLDEQRVRLFRREVQALGRLKHPGIAAIHESGCTEGGEHFFVMELVSGVPLNQYLAENPIRPDHARSDIRARLELFRQICHGISYAHQRGVIHRDLKPSNILVVSEEEGTGKVSTGSSVQVKILDFGLARITDADVSMTTMMTEVGKIQGTLSYMSPEQARGNPDEIDVRSDVYSLGVILYEMLTGELPYDVHRTMIHDAVRVILEEPPRKPSTLIRTLGGDVETIVLKALEKDPQRRYQSAAALGEDVERYLAHQPILARPPSTVYQLRKLVARHRALFGALAVVFVVLVGGLVFSSFMYLNAEKAREETARERDRALASEEEAETAIKFLSDRLAAVDPKEAQGREMTLKGMLDKTAIDIDTAFPGQPLVEATLRATIGTTYRALGEYPTAEPHLETALELRKRELGGEHPDTLVSMSNLAYLYSAQGRYDEAEPLLVQALELQRRVLGEEHLDTLASMSNLAYLYRAQGRYDEAESLYGRTLELQRRVLGEEHPDTLTSMNNLAYLHGNQGRFDEAELLIAQALEVQRRVLGEEHPDTLFSMHNLAVMQFYQGRYDEDRGRYDEAEPLLVQALEIQRRVLGEEHPDTLASMHWLALLYHWQGRSDEGELQYLRTLEIQRRVLGEEHPDTLMSMSNLAFLHLNLGRYDEAEPLFVQALETQRRVLGEEHPFTLYSHWGLARALINQSKWEDAESLAIDYCNKFNNVYDSEDRETRYPSKLFIELYDAWGKPIKAAEWRAKLPEPEPETETSLQQTESAPE